MKMEAKLIQLTASCWAAIDAARGDLSRAAFIESIMWRSRIIKNTGYKPEPRPAPGEWHKDEV